MFLDTQPASTAGAPEATDDNFVFDVLEDAEHKVVETPAPTPSAAPAGAEPPAPAAATPPAAQPGATPSAQPPVDAGKPAQPAAPAAPAGETTPEYQPATFKADGQELQIEGSKQGEDGVFIPTTSWSMVSQLLAEGIAHRGSWRQREEGYTRQIESLRAEKSNERVRYEALTNKLFAILDGGEEAVAAWLAEFKTNLPLLKAEAEQKVLLERQQSMEAQESERAEEAQAQELIPVMQNHIVETIDELVKRPEFSHFDKAAIYDIIVNKMLDDVFTEDASGQTYFHPEEIAGLFEFLGTFGGPKVNVKEIADTAAKNAQAVAAAVPPAVPASSAAPAVPAGGAMPKTKEEWERWVSSGEWRKVFPD